MWSSGKMKTWVLPARRRKAARVQDPVAVALEARAERVGLLLAHPVARAARARGAAGERRVEADPRARARVPATRPAREPPTSMAAVRVAGGPP